MVEYQDIRHSSPPLIEVILYRNSTEHVLVDVLHAFDLDVCVVGQKKPRILVPVEAAWDCLLLSTSANSGSPTSITELEAAVRGLAVFADDGLIGIPLKEPLTAHRLIKSTLATMSGRRWPSVQA